MAIDRENLRVESDKAAWAAIGVVLPILGGLGTVAYGVWSLRKSIEAQFGVKAAEVILQGENSREALGRARFLRAIFGELLPRGFTQRVKEYEAGKHGPVRGGSPGAIMAKKEIIKLLAERPEQRAQILADWRALFPDDEWVSRI